MGDIALLIHHAGTMAHAQKRTDGVEHIDEEEREDAYGHVETQHIVPLELHHYGSDAGWHVEHTGEMCHTQRNAYHGGHQYADEQSTCHLLDKQHGAEQDAECGKQHSRVMQVAHSDKGGRAGRYDAGILQSDKGDEKAYAGRDGTAEHQRHGIYYLLAKACESEQDEDDTLDEYGCEGKLPAITHGEHHGVGKEGIESHARSKGKGQLGIHGHDQGGKH